MFAFVLCRVRAETEARLLPNVVVLDEMLERCDL